MTTADSCTCLLGARKLPDLQHPTCLRSLAQQPGSLQAHGMQSCAFPLLSLVTAVAVMRLAPGGWCRTSGIHECCLCSILKT
jgi:hypothetical protein